MSLRSKLVGILALVFVFVSVSTAVLVNLIHQSAFDEVELDLASDNISRAHSFIARELSRLELLTYDWAQWTDTWKYAQEANETFYQENLEDNYLYSLGINFAAIVTRQAEIRWSRAFLDADNSAALGAVLSDFSGDDGYFLTPGSVDEPLSGVIDTLKGPALVASSLIVKSDGTGTPAGHIVMGVLLDEVKLKQVSETMLLPVDIVGLDVGSEVLSEQDAATVVRASGDDAIVQRRDGTVRTYSVLRDIQGDGVAWLRVSDTADIGTLGEQTLVSLIAVTLALLTATVLTLWVVLRKLLISPLEYLTNVLRRAGQCDATSTADSKLFGAVQGLTINNGSLSKRKDELGELVTAFDTLSESLCKATDSLWRAAHLDGLTGLPNRRMFVERLDAMLKASRQSNSTVTVMFADLDDFKLVNDSLGHEYGDELLRQVSHRLLDVSAYDPQSLKPDDVDTDVFIARLGGDEFVLVFIGGHKHAIDGVVCELVESVAKPYQLQDEVATIGISVGVAEFPADAQSRDTLLRCADAAMYSAKRAKKNTWRRYAASSSSVTDIRRAS